LDRKNRDAMPQDEWEKHKEEEKKVGDVLLYTGDDKSGWRGSLHTYFNALNDRLRKYLK